jgi:hypothetical protein
VASSGVIQVVKIPPRKKVSATDPAAPYTKA